MNCFFLLLASNVDAEKNMAEARRILSAAFPNGLRFSNNHWSEAFVKPGAALPSDSTPSGYLNAVCSGFSSFDLESFRKFLKQAETQMGRLRGPKACGQVVIDLDLVEWNGIVLRPKDAEQEYYQVCLRDL